MVAFIAKLTSMEKELLQTALNDLIQDAAPAKLSQLEAEMIKVKERIDAANQKRQAIGVQCHVAEKVIAMLDRTMETAEGDERALLSALRGLVVDRVYELKVEVEDLRPEDDLSKKCSLRRLHKVLETRRTVGEELLKVMSLFEVKGAKRVDQQ